jgi:hypothetical protein
VTLDGSADNIESDPLRRIETAYFLDVPDFSDSAYHFIIFKQSFFNKTGDIVRTLLQWLSRMFLDSSRGEFKTVAACECLTRDIRSSTGIAGGS